MYNRLIETDLYKDKNNNKTIDQIKSMSDVLDIARVGQS